MLITKCVFIPFILIPVILCNLSVQQYQVLLRETWQNHKLLEEKVSEKPNIESLVNKVKEILDQLSLELNVCIGD